MRLTRRGGIVQPQEIKRSRKASRLMRSGLLILGSYLMGCSGRFPIPSNYQPQPERYHQALTTRGEQVKSLSGELAVELWEKSDRVAIRQLFASEPPRKLRIDTLTPFERPLATLIYNAHLLALHDIERGVFAVGIANQDNFERLTRVRIEPSAMSALLSGQVPRLMTSGGEVTWDETRGRSRLELKREDERELIYFREGDLTPRLVELYRGGELQVRLSLARYTKSEPKIPQRLRFEIPKREIRVEIELKDMTLNPDLPAEAFEVSAPPGVPTTKL